MRHRWAALAGGLAIAAALAITFTASVPHDYGVPACTADPLCDDASVPIDALAAGHVRAFAQEQRLMGPVSEVVRAPFVAAAGGDQKRRYRAGLLPCLIALALVGWALAWLAAERGRPWWFQLLVGVGVVVNPISRAVVDWGHPEELLAAALLVASALAALRGRVGWAGVLAGFAVATKLWALAGLPAVFVALRPPERRRYGIAAAGVAALLIGAVALGSADRFRDNVHVLGRIGSAAGTVSPANIWWRFSDTVAFDAPAGFDSSGAVVTERVSGYSLPRWVARLAHALVMVAAVLIALAWLCRGLPGGPERALLAMALALMLRCVLDPGTFSYYHAPFLIALIAYEALVRRMLPWLSLIAVAGYEILTRGFVDSSRPVFNTAYLLWALPLALAMGIELLATRRHSGATAVASAP